MKSLCDDGLDTVEKKTKPTEVEKPKESDKDEEAK